MSGDKPPQVTSQETIGVTGEPDVAPTPIIQDEGGPNKQTSQPDLDNPVMQFVVQNFDRVNAMYEAFTRKLKELPPQSTLHNDSPIIEPLISDSDDGRIEKARGNIFIESDNHNPYNNRVTIEATPLTKKTSEKIMASTTNHSYSKNQTETCVIW